MLTSAKTPRGFLTEEKDVAHTELLSSADYETYQHLSVFGLRREAT